MLQGKRTRKVIAATMLAVFLSNTLAPLASYALTSGPTQPEATSFEPIDTTDMVNLQTGDFTYNIPLLEVPGPEGGYPLSLSYHAGIQPNEDASWVGLGWTLNPGAINRSVNGYPDDWQNPTGNTHTYWNGGTTYTFSVGITIGIANTPASVNFGLSFSQDTYQGFGSGYYFGLGATYGSLSVGIRKADYGYGGLSTEGYLSGGNVGVSTDFDGNTNYNLNAGTLGISMSSKGTINSVSIDNLTTGVNSTKTPKINTDPSVVGLNLSNSLFTLVIGASKTRYWTDEKANTILHGSLYSSGWPIVDNTAYDTYELLEEPQFRNIIDYSDPTKLVGGAYPDFDIYSVSAQGLGGNMRPYLFKGEVLGQNRKTSDNASLITYYSPGSDHPMPQFRFIGDFSNSYRQGYPQYTSADLSQDLKTITPPFDNFPIYGNSDANYDGVNGDYDGNSFLNNKLAGSKHIDIGVTIKPSNIKGYVKTDRYKNGMIEGFSITNESGVTYHYGLPAYSWAEEIYQERITEPGENFNRQTKTEPYAYTWYLTTITGPDFVDRDGDGKAGNNDWGYWTNFEYGKWSNDYVWRNPSENFQKDEDNEWQNCSMGKKEVYYLNAIRTRSHLAIFEKDIRDDGKGASPEVLAKVNNTKGYIYPQGAYNRNSSQSLKLSKIYLLDITSMNDVNTNYGLSGAYAPSSRSISCDCENASNVFDKTDIDAIGRLNFESKAIRVIDFNYDYSLCSGTTNSYDINNSSSYSINDPSIRNGKLTLKSVLVRGKRGISLIPPTRFEYELPASEVLSQSNVSLSPTNFVTTNGLFQEGDLIVKAGSPAVFCGAIIRKELSSNGNYTYTLVNGNYGGGTVSANIYTTKNPPYNSNGYDVWGMYKSDVVSLSSIKNENIARATSTTSSRAVDVWSLKTITSSLGSKLDINYESDEYRNSDLNKHKYSFTAQNVEKVSGHTDWLKITFDNTAGVNLSKHFPVSSYTRFLMLLRSVHPNSVVYNSFTCIWPQLIYTYEVYDSETGQLPYTQVKEVGLDYIIVQNPGFSDFFQSPVTVHSVDGALITTTCEVNKKPIAANVTLNGSLTSYIYLKGGGVRVKTLALSDESGRIVYTKYKYNTSTSTADRPSGVTSYIPGVFEAVNFFGNADQSAKDSYKKALYKDAHDLLAIAREIPPPGVRYEFVTVTNEIKNVDEPVSRPISGSIQYQFEVFRENMVVRTYSSSVSGNYQGVSQVGVNRMLMKFVNGIGNVKKITKYDNNGKVTFETINHYLHDGLEELSGPDFMSQYKSRLSQYKYQGYLQERYSEVKKVYSPDPLNGIKAVLSAREDYPCIQTGQTTIDYINSTQKKNENKEFDFYSGAVTKTIETDIYGHRFMTEVIPAYRKYAEMGLKLLDSTNKNMLAQTAGVYVYKVDASNAKMGLVSAQVQIWSDMLGVTNISGGGGYQNGGILGNVWRQQSSYSWMPMNKTNDGITVINDFSDMNWSNPGSSNPNWKKTYEAVRYSVFSKPLETIDINGIRSSVKLDYNHKKVIYKVSNAAYYEIAYSGAEENESLSSGLFSVMGWNGVTTTEAAHTGIKSLKLGTGGKKGFLVDCSNALTSYQTGKSFSASVWVKPVTGTVSDVKLYYEINGVQKGASSSANSTKTANGWTLVTLTIPGSDLPETYTFVKIGCRNDHSTVEAYLDDFRLQPVASAATAYIYDPLSGELTYTLDNNNLYTKFEYDEAGRLVKTYREKLGLTNPALVAQSEYNYGATKYLSQPIDANFVKNNCPTTSQAGSTVHINFPEGYRISFESLLDANTQAQAAAQNKTNNEGTCIWLPGTYVRIEYDYNDDTFEGCIYQQTAIVTLRFFSDHACTIPLTVSNLPVNLTLYHDTESSTTTTNTTIFCTGSSKVITTNLMYEYWDDCEGEYIFDYYDLKPGTGYIDVN